MTTKDIKTNQDIDIRMFQHIVKTALGQDSESRVNILSIGNVWIGNNLSDEVKPTIVQNESKRMMKSLEADFSPKEAPGDIELLVDKLIMLLPEPKFDHLIYFILKVACRKSKYKKDVGKLLDIPQTTAGAWINRLGLSVE